VVVCSNCGTELPPSAKFCLECGRRVAPSAGATAASPDAFTPKHLAERILATKAALEGERKQVTVLFADLKGSMELLADRDPEEARKILDPVLRHMMDAVHRDEGTVNQVMGDGIMALFGAPIAHEDHAVRACYAALRMQESVKRYAEEARRAHGVTVQIRVGLNSGEVVVRAIGSDLRMDYTAVGETTHLAARMEQLARPGTVLMTPATLYLAEGFVSVNPLGPVPVRGRREPLEVYELSGVGPALSRLQAAAQHGLTQFVGRDAEVDVLRRLLEQAAAGHGQLVAIVGEAGVGKSRLTWEFTRSHHAHGWLVLRSRSVSYARGRPYVHVIDLLKTYLDIQEGDDSRRVRERVTDKLLTLDRALEPFVTPLLALLDVPVDDAAWRDFDPPQRQQRIVESVKRVLLRESQVQPLLVLFADLHWIDAESLVVLDALIESLPTARILLLVNFRPEYQHAWGSKTYYTLLRIDPLPAESVEKLLTFLLGRDESLVPVKRVLIDRTQGNPFFLEEMVHTLVEREILAGKRGHYRATNAPAEWQIPATIQAILAARIDRLPPEDKALLQAASVIGRDVPFALLKSIADIHEENLRRGLTRLVAGEFLYERSVFPDLEYSFKHALTHETAYGSLLQDHRRVLHARIVSAVEALYGGRLAEQVDRLAHHTFRGEVWPKAVSYLRQAGGKALAHSAYREAVTCFEQGLTALDALPDTPENRERAIDLRLDLRQSLFPLGEFTKVGKYLQEAEELATELDDPRRLGWVSAYLAGQQLHTGGPVSKGRALAERVEAIAERVGDVSLHMAAQYYFVVSATQGGDYRAAEEISRRMMQSFHDARNRERFGLVIPPAFMARTALVHALADRGAFDDGEAQGQEAIRIAEALDHPLSLLWGCIEVAYLASVRGELSRAVPLLERALALSREWNITSHTPIALGFLGHVFALSGRRAEGVAWLEQAVSGYHAAGIGVYHSLSVERLGEAYLLDDRLEHARASAGRALALAHERGERAVQAWTLRLMGDIASHGASPDVAAAEAHYGAALTLASDLDMRPLVAHCHHGLGTLHRRTGNVELRHEHLARAAAMYGEMGMTYWLQTLQEGMSLLG
jgi:class 3 adenylate cyclase/tetratricopeptide (TPR) repeat protein